jgi:hypothetical protein
MMELKLKLNKLCILNTPQEFALIVPESYHLDRLDPYIRAFFPEVAFVNRENASLQLSHAQMASMLVTYY